jgi:hypothetical protein
MTVQLISERSKLLQQRKRKASAGDIEAILALLHRSVQFGHVRLSFYRYCMARAFHDPRVEKYRAYCENIAERLPEKERNDISLRAWKKLGK